MCSRVQLRQCTRCRSGQQQKLQVFHLHRWLSTKPHVDLRVYEKAGIDREYMT